MLLQIYRSECKKVVLKRPTEVYLTGSFNDWQLIPMTSASFAFVTILELPVGVHHYKFVVDGRWVSDPTQPQETPEANVNVLTVDQTDSDPFNALDIDISRQRSRHPIQVGATYGQEIPPLMSAKLKPPPVLPPHLLQVILNKDTPLVCEPTLLPTPNHVMVNHVYALSIKDNVMVMSSTSRYKKKYVTTILYKTI